MSGVSSGCPWTRLTDQTRNLFPHHRHRVNCETCLDLLLLSPSPSSSSLFCVMIFNAVLNENLGEWSKLASSTTQLQGGDKKKTCSQCVID